MDDPTPKEQEQAKRAFSCGEEIKATLEQYRCMLDASMLFKNGQMIPRIEVRALD